MKQYDSHIQVFSAGFVCGVIFGYTNTLGFITGMCTGLYLNQYFPSSTVTYVTRLAQVGKLREMFSK
jgi:hypothetical protein